MFIELESGCEVLDYNTIDSFSRLTGVELSSWEVSTLVKLTAVRAKTNG